MNTEEIDLKREDLAVLHVVSEANQAITTTTIRESIHWADSSRVIRYRLDRLEERDLVDTWTDESRAELHQMPPRVAETTEAGANIADEHEDDPEILPVEERLARIEKQLSKMRETYGEAKQRIVELEKEVEGHDGDLDDLAEEIRNIQRFLEFAERGSDD